MMNNILAQLSSSFNSIAILILMLNAVLHIIFAAGVARDISGFHRRGVPTQFVPGIAWVLATLIGGVFVLLAYWFMHHSNLAR